MLFAKGNAYNSEAKENPPEQMGKGYPESSYDEPYDVHNQIQTPQRILIVTNFTPERPQGENPQFESLYAEWDTYDGYQH